VTEQRRFSRVDRLVLCLDRMRAAARVAPHPDRPTPGSSLVGPGLSLPERRHSARLMRVNHAGEVCAQALYVGQALFAREPRIEHALRQAAIEEIDHLFWCRQRLRDLGARPSRLNPIWLSGALTFGALASLAGDRFSLGFLAETERQVVLHLEGHLRELPERDLASRQMVMAMRDDEARHATNAIAHGAAEMPPWLKTLMRASSRVMTTIAARV
jgi:ubiquinone biosynthesis monooxygenase Coq7